MEQKLYDLLKKIRKGESFFRPEDESDEANIAFKSEANRLRELRDLNYIRLSDKGFMKNHTNGKGYYNIVGPCEITYQGEQILDTLEEEQKNPSALQIIEVNTETIQREQNDVKPVGHPTQDILKTRLQHLSENIAKDFDLLKKYEDALRFEDEPRRRAKYEHEIEELKISARKYAQEYEALERNLPTEERGTETKDSLSLIHEKLETLLAGQNEIHNQLGNLGWAILNRYETSEQIIIKTILERINETQTQTVETVLNAVEQNRLEDNEMRETLEIIQGTLLRIEENGTNVIPEQKKLIETVNAPQLTVKNKLKMMIPIVPLLLNYETEIELGSGVNLEGVWKNLINKFSKK